MTKPSDLRAEAKLAEQLAAERGLTQADIAEAIGASQSQVSRVLAGTARRRSRVFDDVCKYVFSAGTARTNVWQSAELTSALQEVWDGTSAHARALALVIRSLSALSRNSSPGGTPGRRRETSQ